MRINGSWHVPDDMNAIGWILIVWVAGATEFEVWGGYQTQAACERTQSMLDARYERKRQAFRAVCQPVMARQLQP